MARFTKHHSLARLTFTDSESLEGGAGGNEVPQVNLIFDERVFNQMARR
jgi:hypothetical protein